ncbi:uncharacterized protein LOC113386777 isoform X2 [Ctenocephalides felis]|nr:uncharacterized protein LOC113386777 isoform X2 [Ctenocephalides felis]
MMGDFVDGTKRKSGNNSGVIQILDNTITSTSTDDHRGDELVTAFNNDEDEQILTTTVIDTSKDSVSVIRQSDTLERKSNIPSKNTNTAEKSKKPSRNSSNLDEKLRNNHQKSNRYSEGVLYDKNSLDRSTLDKNRDSKNFPGDGQKRTSKHFGGSLERTNIVHIPRVSTLDNPKSRNSSSTLEKQGKDRLPSSSNSRQRNSGSSISFNTLENPDSKRSSQQTNYSNRNSTEVSKQRLSAGTDTVDCPGKNLVNDRLGVETLKRRSEGNYDKPAQPNKEQTRNSSALEKTYTQKLSLQNTGDGLNLKPGQINLTERDLEPYSTIEKDRRKIARNSGKYENGTLERLNFYDNLNNLNSGSSDKKSLVDEYDYDVISGGAAFDLEGIINESFAHPAIRYNGSGLGTNLSSSNLLQQYGSSTLPNVNLLHGTNRSKIDRSNSIIEQRINTLVDRGIDALEPSPIPSRSTLATDTTSASCSGASGSAIDSCPRTTAVSSSCNSSKIGAAVSSSGDRDSVYGGSTLRLCPDRRKQSDYMTSSAASDFEKKRYNLTQQLLTLLCCIAVSLALPSSLGLAKEVRTRGLPFAVAYFVLLFIVGLPLSVVACTVGQFCGEAAAGKAHRAVPLVKGVVIIRALACWSGAACVCLHASLALLQFVLSLSGPTPYRHCTMLRMRHDSGYQAVGLTADECIERTFLAGPIDNPLWYGVLAAISVVTFGFVMLVSRSGPAIRRLLIISSLPLLALMLATLGIGASLTNFEQEKAESDPNLFIPMPTTTSSYTAVPTDADLKAPELVTDWWSLLEVSLWLAAVNQLLFATTLGFGVLPALCGRALHKADAVKTAVTFIICLCLSGALSMVCAFVLADSEFGGGSLGSNWGSPAEAYNLAQHAPSLYAKALLGVAHGWYGLGSLVTMALFSFSLSCTLRRPSSLLGIVLGAALIIRLCVAVPPGAWPSLVGERSLVPTLAAVALCVESLALLLVYGPKRLWSDIEFSVGRPVSKVWHWTATISCLILLGLFAWYYSMPITNSDFELDRTTSWITAASSMILLLIAAGHEVARQVGYNLLEKFRSACRPSLEWGPGDPVVRHSWKLWGGAPGRGGAPGTDGERDFTLRRKGTRDYTHSARRQASRKEAGGPPGGKRYPVPVLSYDNFGADLGEFLTVGGYTKSQSHHDHITDIDFVRKQSDDNLMADNSGSLNRNRHDNNYGSTDCYERAAGNAGQEDIDGLKRGPYVLPDVDHICWRREAEHNLRTNL